MKNMMAFKKAFFAAVLATALIPMKGVVADEEPPKEASEIMDDEPEAVLTLTNASFDGTIKDNATVLVKFYAPWCGHCKRMAPEYEKAAKMLRKKNSAVVLGKVDATSENDLANKHNISEYPTILLFRKGVSEKYTGGRFADGIVQWIERMTGPAVMEVDGDIAEAIKKEEAKVAFVGEFVSKDEELSKLFEEVAESARQLGKFFRKTGASETKVYVERLGEGVTPFEGKTSKELKEFVDLESFFLIGPINGENYSSYNDRDFEMVWFYGQQADFDAHKGELQKAAKEFRSGYSFVWLDANDFKGYAENNLRLTETPGLAYQNSKGARFILPDPKNSLADAQKVIDFMNDVKSGKIKRDIKSEPVPEKNDEPVKVVVGQNFEEIVLSADKDVMLEIYAPWCGYCKSFEPIYTEFATKIKDIDHIVIAKMDGIANDAPVDEFQYESFPTIYWLKAGEKQPMKFDGARTVDGLIEYIKKNSSKAVEIGDKHDEL